LTLGGLKFSLGLLAGLLDFASSVDVSKIISEEDVKFKSLQLLGELFGQTFFEPLAPSQSGSCCKKDDEVRVTRLSVLGDVSHIFSHIKKTYRVVWVLLTGGSVPPKLNRDFTLIKPSGKKLRRQARRSTGEGRLTTFENGVWISLNEVKDAT
jgi:A/G-specific adenine glycosylase